MAKHDKNTSNDDQGEIEFQFVHVKLKGSARTLEHTMQSVLATLRQNGVARPIVANGSPKPPPALREVAQVEETVEPEIDTDDYEVEGEAPSAPETPTSRRRVPRKPAFKTLNWDGPPAWKDLVAKYNPSGQWERLVLIAYWCKKVGIIEIGADELFSAWKWANCSKCIRSRGLWRLSTASTSPGRLSSRPTRLVA